MNRMKTTSRSTTIFDYTQFVWIIFYEFWRFWMKFI
ncbi:unnamed protein product [Brassica napus]|uniref:(rape) hypothetical protein n=1 Tax=Brassica napus TaxID=3708 RepID=A0A816JGT0_BRANA|nr:unnamed protein product [Brassica napus]CAF1779628.1 unnamed protein product [Brassica napus]